MKIGSERDAPRDDWAPPESLEDAIRSINRASGDDGTRRDPQVPARRRPPNPFRRPRPPISTSALLCITGASMIVIAAFLPWARFSLTNAFVAGEFDVVHTFSASMNWAITGSDLPHGYLFVMLASIGVYGRWIRSRGWLTVTIWSGLLAAGIAAYDWADLAAVADSFTPLGQERSAADDGYAAFDITWSPVVAVAGSVLMAGSAAFTRVVRT